jgi:GNAT superfamily N-acetyltransferase
LDNVVISDLRRQPAFTDAVADRIWRAWWKQRGTPLSEIRSWLEQSLSASALPFALVAHQGADFVGISTVIVSDLADRPDYSPWVATVWVEPDFRNRQVGRALVARAVRDAFALGFDPVYLCARRELDNFYAGLGWSPVERDVGDRRLTVFSLAAQARPPQFGLCGDPP